MMTGFLSLFRLIVNDDLLPKKNPLNSSRVLQCYLMKNAVAIILRTQPRWTFYCSSFRKTQSWNTRMRAQASVVLHIL